MRHYPVRLASCYILDSTYDHPVDIFWNGFDFAYMKEQNPHIDYIQYMSAMIDDSGRRMYWHNYNIREIYDYCVENCSEEFGFTVENTWYFHSEIDQIQFMMRWK